MVQSCALTDSSKNTLNVQPMWHRRVTVNKFKALTNRLEAAKWNRSTQLSLVALEPGIAQYKRQVLGEFNISEYQKIKRIGDIEKDIVDSGLAILTLNDNCRIHHCNNRSGKLLDWQTNDLMGQHVSVVLPELAGIDLFSNEQINPQLQFWVHIGRRFAVLGQYGNLFKCKLFFSHNSYRDQNYVYIIIHKIEKHMDVLQ